MSFYSAWDIKLYALLDNRAKSRMKDGNRCKIKMQNLQNANNIDDMPYFCKLDSIDMKTVVF